MPGLNLGQLVNKVFQTCGEDIADSARVEAMLNEAQDEVSNQVKAPTKEVHIRNVTGAFELPEAEYNGILEVHSRPVGAITGGYRVRLRTTTEASRYDPNWRANLSGEYPHPSGGSVQYLIYDPVNISAPLVPMPRGSGAQDLYIKLHLRPNPMVEYGDYPLNGELPNSHEALWQYVCFQLFNELPDERSAQRGQMAYARYNALLNRMMSDARPEPVFPERETATSYEWGHGWGEPRGGRW